MLNCDFKEIEPERFQYCVFALIKQTECKQFSFHCMYYD